MNACVNGAAPLPDHKNGRNSMNRHEQMQNLADADLDFLVIGGGASGAGVLLDAASRGFRVGLIERQDFMSGTSSRSTKLVHGGVRYLEQAVKTLDHGMLTLVREALRERKTMLNMAPHLARPIALVTPLQSRWQWPYLRTGLGVYDWLAGTQSVGQTTTLNQEDLRQSCAALKPNFPIGVRYWDGQFDDARFGIAMIRSGVDHGASALNHCSIEKIERIDNGYRVRVKERFSEQVITLTCKVIINCTGPWTDVIREQVRPNSQTVVKTSSGAHIVVSKTKVPIQDAVLIPKTDDGRVLFMIPWYGQVLIGTTDTIEGLSDNPITSAEEISYLIHEANKWLQNPLKTGDVQATFKGLRPLVDDQAASTAKISRDHQVIREDRVLSLTGGKWTTWRSMAQDAVDQAITIAELPETPCITASLKLAGCGKPNTSELEKVDVDIAAHLRRCYGGEASSVLKMGSLNRIVPHYPWIEAEIAWALEKEAAVLPEDILERRLRMNTVDHKAYQAALDKLAEP